MIGVESLEPPAIGADAAAPLLWPAMVGAATLGGWLLWRHRRPSQASADTPPSDERQDDANADPASEAPTTTVAHLDGPPPAPSGRWVVPVACWQGRRPVVSDGWGSPRDGGRRRHRGVDVMFRRRTRDEYGTLFPPRAPHSTWHFLPPGTLVLAASDADVWSAGWTPHGYAVVLSHGAPWATCYRHLASLRVAETRRGASRERVRAGQPLGYVGVDPTDPNGVAHLHFELWFGGGASAAVDPAPYLRRWPAIDPPEVV